VSVSTSNEEHKSDREKDAKSSIVFRFPISPFSLLLLPLPLLQPGKEIDE